MKYISEEGDLGVFIADNGRFAKGRQRGRLKMLECAERFEAVALQYEIR